MWVIMTLVFILQTIFAKMSGNKDFFFIISLSFACSPHLFLSFSFISDPFLFPQGAAAAAAAASNMVAPQRFKGLLFAILKGTLDLFVEAPGGWGVSIRVLWL